MQSEAPYFALPLCSIYGIYTVETVLHTVSQISIKVSYIVSAASRR